MPSFDFSLPRKKAKKRQAVKSNNRLEVVLKNTEGIVWCDENGEYSVDINDGFTYPIHNSCYSCKKHARIYRRGVPFNDRFIYIRAIGEYHECNPKHYLPFAPGCIVIGDLVKTSNNVSNLFIIKKCWTNPDNEKSREAIAFYKKHIDEINSKIKNKM